MNGDISNLRKDIDRINFELLEMVNRRASILKEISRLKDDASMDYFDPVREEKMMEDLVKNNQGPLPNGLVKEIFTAIFKASLQYMGINRDRRLLVSSGYDNGFLNIRQMFGLSSDRPIIIAGPCAIEKAEYLETIAELLSKNGIGFLRGGAFKPRTSPYDFQGLRLEGLKILKAVGKAFGLITVTEVVDTRDVEIVAQYADVLQIGARNMQNYEMLKEVGQADRPVLLKRGMSATIQEFILASEYIGLQGNRKILLCERGIRTYETKTRNTLDIASIPIVKKETSLPMLVDLSHSLGRKDIVNPIAKSVLAAGADGLMVEVHPYPEIAVSDSKQQLTPEEFLELLKFIGMAANSGIGGE